MMHKARVPYGEMSGFPICIPVKQNSGIIAFARVEGFYSKYKLIRLLKVDDSICNCWPFHHNLAFSIQRECPEVIQVRTIIFPCERIQIFL